MCTVFIIIIYEWVDTCAGGLLIPELSYHPLSNQRFDTDIRFIRYNYNWNLQFLDSLIYEHQSHSDNDNLS